MKRNSRCSIAYLNCYITVKKIDFFFPISINLNDLSLRQKIQLNEGSNTNYQENKI